MGGGGGGGGCDELRMMLTRTPTNSGLLQKDGKITCTVAGIIWSEAKGVTFRSLALQWRHKWRDGVSNHQYQIVYSTVYSGVDQSKHKSPASLAFVREIHRWPVNSPHKRPVTRKMFPFDDVIMLRVNVKTMNTNTHIAKYYQGSEGSWKSLKSICWIHWIP